MVIKKQGAASSFRATSKQPPLNVSAELETAYQHFNNKQYIAAEQRLKRILASQPRHLEALNVLAVILGMANRLHEAISILERALALDPKAIDQRANYGLALFNTGKPDAALTQYDKVLALQPTHQNALFNRALCLNELRRTQESIDQFRALKHIAPHYNGLNAHLLFTQSTVCDWTDYDALVQTIREEVNVGQQLSPFAFIAHVSNRHEQQKAGSNYERIKYNQHVAPLWTSERYTHTRIRIGYLSADLQNHATAFLMAELFEQHNRDQFELFAFSYGPEVHDEMRTRLVNAFEHFIPIQQLSDLEAAECIRAHEIDILIDLKGYTKDCRPQICLYHPAPVQVSFIGYPGTLGSACMHYIIGDAWVTPLEHAADYSETIVHMPWSYQVNDRKRPIPQPTPSRTELGLPEDAFIFCCFNQNYKMTPHTFNVWMQILQKCPHAVLWLMQDNESAANNLRQAALQSGVDPNRLYFAPRTSTTEHLRRQAVADLFLDTLPYNAHTTTSDALWMGLPVLTCVGESFAGRVAASLLHAAQLTELITCSTQEYINKACFWATHPNGTQSLKQHLTEQRLNLPLFDARLFARHFEQALHIMWERTQHGLPHNTPIVIAP